MDNKDNIIINNQTDSEQVEYLIQKLNELDESLTKIELSKSAELNMFYATGMTTQEINIPHFWHGCLILIKVIKWAMRFFRVF